MELRRKRCSVKTHSGDASYLSMTNIVLFSQAVLLMALRVAGPAVFHFIKECRSLYFLAP